MGRTATLRNDFEGQAVLINCLLRNYLNYNLYNQADKLVLKSTFPEQASNSEWARYYYYLGRIKAIQLAYSEAHSHLLQSGRKAPQNSAPGFKQHVAKLSITVETKSYFGHVLLMASLICHLKFFSFLLVTFQNSIFSEIFKIGIKTVIQLDANIYLK